MRPDHPFQRLERGFRLFERIGSGGLHQPHRVGIEPFQQCVHDLMLLPQLVDHRAQSVAAAPLQMREDPVFFRPVVIVEELAFLPAERTELAIVARHLHLGQGLCQRGRRDAA